ncbi:MAG TPA: copper resistance CopC family protein [Steroidobacteraceae bacterium]|jgi:methionine-rich copper-binding protein CopC|nr:copper resistance CopC family protein [Steroidobacteraceae bacterium]
MKPPRLLLTMVLSATATLAAAHAHLEEASPANGAVLHAAPRELVLRFTEPAQLTALTLARTGDTPVPLAPLPSAPQQRIVVALPALAPGSYQVSYRALSADGHIVPGQLRFTLSQ